MLFSVPPLMVLIPAMLPFGIQVAAAIIRLPAMFSMIVNSPVQPRFGVFHCMLALRTIIGMRNRYCNEPRERRGQHRRYCGFSQSLKQVFLLVHGTHRRFI
jgi:hypothetical protein